MMCNHWLASRRIHCIIELLDADVVSYAVSLGSCSKCSSGHNQLYILKALTNALKAKHLVSSHFVANALVLS